MTLALQQYGVEPILVVEIDWGNESSPIKYADRDVAAISAVGAILSASAVSKRGTIEQSNVSRTCSVTLDDTDGSIKTIYDTKVIEGSLCSVYHYFAGTQSPPSLNLLFKGKITSDISWSEGERQLDFSIEEGDRTGQSSELGYAPEENAFVDLNPNAVGKNWPLVFGTAVKVPAVRVIYQDDLKTLESFDYDSVSVQIENGDQLPQGTPITLTFDGLICTGTMSGDVFTFTTKNDAKYSGMAFADRPTSDDDFNNPTVAWVDSVATQIVKTYCIVQINDSWVVNYCFAQEGTKCYFNQLWSFNEKMDSSYTFSAAKWPRTPWPTTYFAFTEGGNEMLEVGKDTWIVKKNTPVLYEDSLETYVCNLVTSDDILEVWGRRKYFKDTIWEKIPSSYYTKDLDYTIITNPGAVERHVTVLQFERSLSKIECEGWLDEVYVTLTSSLSNEPKEIAKWVTENYTTFSFDNTNSDDPPITMNFAYFRTIDAFEFIKQIAWQAVSTVIVTSDVLKLRQLAKTPAPGGTTPLHVLTTSLVIMKSLILGSKTIEDINTRIIATYVTDYTGDKTAQHEYIARENESIYGIQEKDYDMFALTCYNAVKAVSDFWSYRASSSWKTLKCKCFIDATDFEVFDNVLIQLSSFIAFNTHGVITSVSHNTDTPNIDVEIEFAIKVGESSEDSDYWNLGTAICATPTGSEIDFVPSQDDQCAIHYSAQKIIRTPYHLAITRIIPAVPWKWVTFTLEIHLHDREHHLRTDTSNVEVKIYTTNPGDTFFKDTVLMSAGIIIINNIRWRISLFPSIIRVFCTPENKDIKTGEIHYEPDGE